MLRPLRLLLVAILTVHFVSGCSTEPERTLSREMHAAFDAGLALGAQPDPWSAATPLVDNFPSFGDRAHPNPAVAERACTSNASRSRLLVAASREQRFDPPESCLHKVCKRLSGDRLTPMAFNHANRLIAVGHQIDERTALKDQIQAIVTVLSLVNPAICGMLFARAEAGGRPPGDQLLDATKGALAILAILVGAALVGTQVLHLFGVSLDAFMLAGGGALACMGFSMLSGFPRLGLVKLRLGQTRQQGLETLRQHAHRYRRENQTHDACDDAHAGIS